MIFTTIPDGIVHKDKHDATEKALRSEVDVCVAGGCEKIIAFGGQRRACPTNRASTTARCS